MRHFSLPIGFIAVAAFSLLVNATPARAVGQTWVSGTGSDSGTCPITAPCLTLQFAHNQTSNGGAINVLSSGSFGPLTITKSISIVAEGVEAAINTAAGGAGIIVNANFSTVSLRGLTLDLTGDNGISFVSGAALHVHNSVIRGTASGIKFAPASGTSELFVANSVIANTSGGTVAAGLLVKPTGSGSARVVLDSVRVENGGMGIGFFGTTTTGSIRTTVRDSVSAGHGGPGIAAVESGSGTVNVTVDRTASVNNSTGILSDGTGATIAIGDSTISGNAFALSTQSLGVIESYKTNKIRANTNPGATPTTIAHK